MLAWVSEDPDIEVLPLNYYKNWTMNPLFLHLLLVQSLLWLITGAASSSFSHHRATSLFAKSGCINHCGKVKIPYPFGIGANCFRNPFYEIVCRNNNSFDRPTPFLRYYGLEVLEINWPESHIMFDGYTAEDNKQLLTVLIPPRNICGSDGAGVPLLDFGGSPYRVTDHLNDFIVVGCGGSVVLKNSSGDILGGCSSLCTNSSSTTANIDTTTCSGVGCCRSTASVHGSVSYNVEIDHTTATISKTCKLAAGFIKKDLVEKVAHLKKFPTVLEWSVANTDNFLRSDDTFSCMNDSSWEGTLICWCNLYDEGNPYILNGCHVVRECRKCKHHCVYDPVYGPGGFEHHYYCVNPLLKQGPVLGFSIGIGSVLLLLSCYWLYRVIKRKREAKRRAKYFKRNGGLLLQQHMSSSEGAFEKTKVFLVTELEKATNNFNKNRILGQGGQGTVYKGMLTDGKIVAIKKSKLIDESQLEHFINELVVLSQINHRNVVKLLGCCLETEVPMLVYEFIPNGTLYHLLHSPSEDFHITWKMRLQIAAESADALAYLHSSSSTPIYHRDIKSSNILLDEKYRAKVSDFGTSRAITIEQTHVTTCVMGTYGYLDPEYFQSNQFTEKSDVYSFGVVLVELITGRKPICPTKSGGWISLAYDFLLHMETSRLFDILDERVLEEGKEEEFIAVANLARQCLSMNGKLRPSMKEIAVVLDGIRSHKLLILKEPHFEETRYVVTGETTDMHRAPFRANMFSLESRAGSSSSVDAPPLMPYTF